MCYCDPWLFELFLNYCMSCSYIHLLLALRANLICFCVYKKLPIKLHVASVRKDSVYSSRTTILSWSFEPYLREEVFIWLYYKGRYKCICIYRLSNGSMDGWVALLYTILYVLLLRQLWIGIQAFSKCIIRFSYSIKINVAHSTIVGVIVKD